MRACPFDLLSNILNKDSSTEKGIFFNKGSIFFIISGDHGGNCVSESFPINVPKERGFDCLD